MYRRIDGISSGVELDVGKLMFLVTTRATIRMSLPHATIFLSLFLIFITHAHVVSLSSWKVIFISLLKQITGGRLLRRRLISLIVNRQMHFV